MLPWKTLEAFPAEADQELEEYKRDASTKAGFAHFAGMAILLSKYDMSNATQSIIPLAKQGRPLAP